MEWNATTTQGLPDPQSREGRRPGAGRKPNIAKRLLGGLKPMTAAESLEGIDVRLSEIDRSLVY
jgi:hypothetical protein